MSGVDVRDLVRGEAWPAAVPGRLRRPLMRLESKAMPNEWCAEMGRALFDSRRDTDGEDLERRAPSLVADLRARLIALLPAALEACGVAEFDLLGCEMIAALHHHGGRSGWFSGLDGANPERRRIGFELTMRTEPPMFSGGELETVSGETVAPDNARLVWLNPLQSVRIREVECWSAFPMHGRWSIWGWLHGAPPDGWDRIVDRMRIRPDS